MHFIRLVVASTFVGSFAAFSLLAMKERPAGPGEEREIGRFEQLSCPICLNDLRVFVEGQAAVQELPCGHVIHRSCYDNWQRSDICRLGNIMCPLCRAVDCFSHALENLYDRAEDWQRFFRNCLSMSPNIVRCCDGFGNTLLQHALNAAIGLPEHGRDPNYEPLIAIILELIRNPETAVIRGRRLVQLHVVRPIARALAFEDAEAGDHEPQDNPLNVYPSPRRLVIRLYDMSVIEAFEERWLVDHRIDALVPVKGADIDADDAVTPPSSPQGARYCPGAPQRPRYLHENSSDSDDE
jgi:ribosomal protein S27E